MHLANRPISLAVIAIVLSHAGHASAKPPVSCDHLSLLEPKERKWCLEERSIDRESTLRDWCEQKSELFLRSQEKAPYNWTAQYWNYAGVLYVEGEWRIDSETVNIQCSIEKGRKAKSADMKLQKNKKAK